MRAVLSAAEVERLTKLLGMLGSDHVGERAVAGLLASRLVRDRGLTWNEIIAGGTAAQQTVRIDSSPLAEVQFVLDHARSLTAWEQTFVNSVSRRPRWEWTPKQ